MLSIASWTAAALSASTSPPPLFTIVMICDCRKGDPRIVICCLRQVLGAMCMVGTTALSRAMPAFAAFQSSIQEPSGRSDSSCRRGGCLGRFLPYTGTRSFCTFERATNKLVSLVSLADSMAPNTVPVLRGFSASGRDTSLLLFRLIHPLRSFKTPRKSWVEFRFSLIELRLVSIVASRPSGFDSRT
jgi:hypothetical protein